MARNTVRFGAYELEFDAGVLRKNGVQLKLQDQPFQILSALLERPGEIVTREDLCRRLWPDGTFVDFDHSLNASVNKLREVLGDSASNPRFIQTVPKRGYRFVAPVQSRQPAVKATRKLALATGAILILAGVSAAWWRERTRAVEPVPQIIPLTSSPGMEVHPDFSPDGNHVVYVSRIRAFDPGDLYIKPVGSGEARPLGSPQTRGAYPKWSPDGRSIVFLRFTDAHDIAEASVIVIPAFGGNERAIPQPLVRMRSRDYAFVDWLADSEHIVLADANAQLTTSLFIVHTRTGERRRLTTAPPGGFGDVDPVVSPDGTRVAFTRLRSGPHAGGIYVQRLNSNLLPSGEPRQIAGRASRALAWMPDGKELVISFGPHHRKRLMRIHTDGDTPARPLPFAAEGSTVITATVSAHGQLVYPVSHGDVKMSRTDLTPQNVIISTHEILASTSNDHMPDYSPDGKRIAFISNRTGSQEVWISKADGSEPYQLTSLGDQAEATWVRWSPVEDRLLFSANHSIHVINATGGKPQVLYQGSSGYLVGEWSRDGKTIYVSRQVTGRPEIWKLPAEPNATHAIQLTTDGGNVPRLSPDGRFLYFTRGAFPAQVWRVPANGGREELVVEQIANNGAFTTGKGGLYFIPPSDAKGKTAIWLRDRSADSPRPLVPLNVDPMWGLAVSPDGRSIVHVGVEAPQSDLMLVSNFR